MHRQIFINLPVKNLQRSVAFFSALGYRNPSPTPRRAWRCWCACPATAVKKSTSWSPRRAAPAARCPTGRRTMDSCTPMGSPIPCSCHARLTTALRTPRGIRAARLLVAGDENPDRPSIAPPAARDLGRREARRIITHGLEEYNSVRPHGALNGLTPRAFAAQCSHQSLGKVA